MKPCQRRPQSAIMLLSALLTPYTSQGFLRVMTSASDNLQDLMIFQKGVNIKAGLAKRGQRSCNCSVSRGEVVSAKQRKKKKRQTPNTFDLLNFADKSSAEKRSWHSTTISLCSWRQTLCSPLSVWVFSLSAISLNSSEVKRLWHWTSEWPPIRAWFTLRD